MPYSCRGEGLCLRAAQDEVSTERPSIIRKCTHLQCNIPLLQTINSVIRKADSPSVLNVINKLEVNTLSPPSFSIHCQEMSAVSLSPSHCTHKESNADSDSPPHQESSASSETDSTNSYLPDSLMEEKDGGKWAIFSVNLLEQFEDGVEYIESNLQGELPEAFSLAVNAEESKSTKCSHFETISPRVTTIVACKCHALPKHASTGIM